MKKKKYIKKIILCISLVAVLVSSMVIPSFAYEFDSNHKLVTWYDYLGKTDLYYNMFYKNISKNSYGYWMQGDLEVSTDYILFQLLSPTDFGNYAAYNGTFAVRFANSEKNLMGNYDYQLGYFDFVSTNRYHESGTASGVIRSYVFDFQTYSDYYFANGYLPYECYEFSGLIETQILKYAGDIPLNSKMLVTSISATYYESNADSLYMGICVYPSVMTSDDIYRKVLDDYDRVAASNNTLTSENETLKSENASLVEENNSLSSANTDLQLKYDQAVSDQTAYALQIEQYKSENERLTAENAELDEMNKILVNNKENLEESLANTNSLTALFNGIGQGFTNIIDSISSLGIGGITIGACITVAVVIFVVFIIIKLVLR